MVTTTHGGASSPRKQPGGVQRRRFSPVNSSLRRTIPADWQLHTLRRRRNTRLQQVSSDGGDGLFLQRQLGFFSSDSLFIYGVVPYGSIPPASCGDKQGRRIPA
ncbi:unnamed protein product [Cuscuta europaea]|uniref:Uncharacterized protein n=1 Tax=Cuscuta europaea TaxID=41803 RepID=A0A9P0ZBS6_CUSEU|nr:unnamed protein product [Cuscuta europaea]